MKPIRKTLLASAVATGMLASGAFAATVNNPSTAAVPTYGKNIVNETVRTVVTPVATAVTLGATEALNVDDSITFTLSGGATFAAIALGDLTAAPNVNGAAFALVAGGVGSNSATFRVTTANTDVAAVLTLAATATFNGAAVSDNGAIDVTVDMAGLVGGIPTSLYGSPLTSLNTDLVPMATAAVTPTGGIADVWSVASGFTTLLGTGTTSSAAVNVAVTENAAATANQTTAGVPTAIPTPANTIFTIKGPMSGLTSITTDADVTSATATGGVPTGGTVANTFFIDVANDAAYAIGSVNNPNPNITITANGSAQPASVYTVDVTRTADAAGYNATTVASGLTIATFTRNGSAFTSNSLGPLNKVTVTDRSGAIGAGGADGVIAITAYDAAGAVVSCTGLSIAALTNNGTVTIPGSDITDSCPGAKRIEGVVNSANIVVTNVKKTADGATATPGVSTAGAAVGI